MKTLFIVNSEFFGNGNDELGQKLMGAFLKKLWAKQKKPQYIVFYNSAVKLLAKGSLHLDALHGLSDLGVDLIACGTCVDFYGLTDCIEIGRISGMEEIVNLMELCPKVITV